MKAMRLLGLFLAGALITASAFSAPVTFTRSGYHYLFSVPPGWERAPQTVLDALNAKIPPQADVTYDIALQPSAHPPRGFPYVLIEIFSSKDTGLTRLPTENEFIKFAGQFTGTIKIIRQQLIGLRSKDEIHQIALTESNALSASTLQVDVKHRTFAVAAKNANIDGIPTSSLVAGIFLPDGSLVAFYCYSPMASFTKNLPTFMMIIGSLRGHPANS